MKKALFIVLAALCVSLYAEDLEKKEGEAEAVKSEKDNSSFETEDKHFSLSAKIDDTEENIIFTIKAETDGWVSIGFGAVSKMKGAEIIIAAVEEGKGNISHEYGNSAFGHKTIESDESIIEIVSAEEKDGVSTLVIKRKLVEKSKYYKALGKGTHSFIWATSPSDGFWMKHFKRGHGSIIVE